MRLVPSKTPWLFKKLFPNYVWEFLSTNKHEKVIYLTFDDGPIPKITPWVLSILKQYNAKATFFCIGNNIEKHPEIFNKILAEGHSIGNHTHTHVQGWCTKTEVYLEDFKKAERIINAQIANSEIQNSEIINQKSLIVNLFRPPFGQLKNKQGKALIKRGYKIIMWDVVTFDWEDYMTPKKCLNKVLKNATNRSIIVFHDSVKASRNMQYALPKVLEHYTQKGFRFAPITSKNFSG